MLRGWVVKKGRSDKNIVTEKCEVGRKKISGSSWHLVFYFPPIK